jgi:peptide chain release factor 1
MSLLSKLESIVDKFHYLEERLSDPALQSDMKLAVKTNKEYSDLKPIVDVYHTYKNVLDNIESTKEMLKDEDPEIREMADSELQALMEERDKLDGEIKVILIPKDPEDSKDIIVEIRSGTGGDEASIFAGDLYKMYSRYFETKGWKVEILDINEGTVGGYNKISLEVYGDGVYGKMKFESGAHRVQRVPETETKGRVHTSAATVVVMPKYDIEEIDIKKDDLRTDTFRASGAGGQHVNKTESGVRFTHIPTGIVAESTDSRSQHKNREIALQRLYVKIQEAQKNKVYNEQKEQRKSLVGSGDRSDKIRTYNFPQNRVTDHRINLTLYSLDKVMAGEIDGIIEALQVAENTSKMSASEED